MFNLKSHICILFFLFPIFISAQLKNADSIYRIYLSEKNDTLKIKFHLQYIFILLNENRPKETEAAIVSVKKELNTLPVAAMLPVVLYYEGWLKYSQSNYLQSIIAFEQCAKLFHPEGGKKDYGLHSGNIYDFLGLSYTMINDWENAQLNYQNAIREYEKFNDSAGTAFSYFNMAYIYSDVNDWKSAAETLKKAIRYLSSATNKEYQAEIYASLSEASSRLNNLDESNIYLKKSESLIGSVSEPSVKTFYFIAKAENALIKKNYSEALPASLNSLDYARKWGDSAFVAYTMANIARIYQASRKNTEASDYLAMSTAIAVKYNYMPQREINLRQFVQFYKDNGQFQKAAGAADDLFVIYDSLSIVQNNNRRLIMDAVFESEKKEKKIAALEQEKELQQLRLKQKNTFNSILISSVIILLFFLLLVYRNYIQKQKLQQLRINELETDKQLTATEAVLRGEERERTRLAKDLHDGLGGLLSGVKFSLINMKDNLIITPENMVVFERSLDMIDTSIKELRRVAHNMMPEILTKFGLDEALKEYCNSINTTQLLTVKYQSLGMETRLENSVEIIIYRIVQELLNNTMKHAAATDSFVQLIRQDNRLSIVVEDNGKGFDTNFAPSNDGAGLANVRSRVDYLKGQYAIHTESGKGTLVNIEFNV
jgi:two-component system, NarL family, sensor kinase